MAREFAYTHDNQRRWYNRHRHRHRHRHRRSKLRLTLDAHDTRYITNPIH